MTPFDNPSLIDTRFDSRSASFENPLGEKGKGGMTHGGRKGFPSKTIMPQETVTLLETEGPGTVRHLWFTVPPAPPEHLRSFALNVYYDGNEQPSISVPILDLCGAVHGRPTEFFAEMIAVHEARGFNCWIPMPFKQSIKLEFVNHSHFPTRLYYQVDFTLESAVPESGSHGYLHSSFRRENPTTLKQDFVISDGLQGPGRFLGCVVGVRVLDAGMWYGEGEVKMYLDNDTDHPTICGTGLEDYVGTAWGMRQHAGPYCGVPLDLRAPQEDGELARNPDFVSFYRFHQRDPIMFKENVKVTIQQIGFALFTRDQEALLEVYEKTHPPAGEGWGKNEHIAAAGICERVDDYCAVDFVYCEQIQSVNRYDPALGTADLSRREWEPVDPMEETLASIGGIA